MNPDSDTQAMAGSLGRSSLFGDLDLGPNSIGQQEPLNPAEDLEASSHDSALSPVMSLVDRILIEALTHSASDIHVEPQEDGLLIRFRQDGVLRNVEKLPRTLTPAITSRFKIMADLDIAERRLPQDGRIRRKFRGRRKWCCGCSTAGPRSWAWTC
jgi:type IV pilus assembly protein PilB